MTHLRKNRSSQTLRKAGMVDRYKGSFLSVYPSLHSWKGLTLLAVVSFAFFYLLESFTHYPWTVPFGMQLFNATFFLLYLLLWLSISGRGTLAVAITCGTSLLIGYANYVVIILRDNPILPWDLLSLQTALSVSGHYQMPVPRHLWVLLLAAALLCFLAVKVRLRLQGARPRLVLLTACLVLLVGYGGALQSSRFTGFFYFNETLFTPDYLYRQNGFIPSFLMNLRYLRIEEPVDYSPAQVAELAADIDELAESYLIDPVIQPDDTVQTPNLLVVMNETFSDPAVLSEIKVNADFMPYFRSLTENTVRGDLFVSVIGGNTATTEFEFLTGDSMAFLPPGSIAYQQYIHDDHPGLPSVLKDLGYKTIAMHPYAPGGWDRDDVYDHFGFDEALFIDDFTHLEYIRHYVSDRSVYHEMIDAYEHKDDGEPLFCFAVTMQNHGGYDTAGDHFSPTIQVLNEGDDFTLLDTYLSLIKESDQALQELIAYFTAVDEPTVILFFGDHQPHDQAVAGLLAQNSYGLDESTLQQNRYLVPFLIWANYDIAEQDGLVTSANFLSALLLETAGLPLSGYHVFLAELSRKIPVMTASFFMDNDGRRLPYEAVDAEQDAWLQDYALLQYNHLFDPANRLRALFEPFYAAH